MAQYHSARVYALLLPLTVALLACNSSSRSSASPTDTTAPTISSTSPVDGATGEATSSAVTVTFDEEIFAVTVDGASFTLLGNGNVSGAVSFDGVNNTAMFTPDAALGLLAPYTATLTTAITDLSGNPLDSNVTWSFITADGAWGVAELIETDNTGDAYYPQIAVDANGNALAVWQQSHGTRYNISAKHFD